MSARFCPGRGGIAAALFALTSTLTLDAQPRPAGQSVYTDLHGTKCAPVKRLELNRASVQSCPGPGGFRLLVEDDDDRMSVTVVAPNGREHALRYWDVITHSFSSLGSQAEWRVRKQGNTVVPYALVVRVNATEEVDGASRRRSYLAVARITPETSCVTDRVLGDANANETARKAADAAASKPCLNGE